MACTTYLVKQAIDGVTARSELDLISHSSRKEVGYARTLGRVLRRNEVLVLVEYVHYLRIEFSHH
jgi:hypothetical protein